MKHLLQTLACALLISSFMSCIKSDDAESEQKQEVSRYIFSKEELAYLQIPDNRIFVYKDSATGSIDSVKLLNFSLYTAYGLPDNWSGPPLSAPYYPYQKVSFSLVHLRDSSDWLTAHSTNPGPSGNISVRTDGYMPGLNWYGTIFRGCFNPFKMTVENKSYGEVVRQPFDLSETDDEFYWAKGVGIIKISIRDSAKVFTYTLIN